MLPLAETLDVGKLVTGVVGAIFTGVIGVGIARAKRPMGHDLERLWELRSKSPKGKPGDVARGYLDEEVTKVIDRARNVEYRYSWTVVQYVVAYLFIVWQEDFFAGVARPIGRAYGLLFGTNVPTWLAIVLGVTLVIVELLLLVLVGRSLWIVGREWVHRFTGWEWDVRRLVSVLLGLLVLLAALLVRAAHEISKR